MHIPDILNSNLGLLLSTFVLGILFSKIFSLLKNSYALDQNKIVTLLSILNTLLLLFFTICFIFNFGEFYRYSFYFKRNFFLGDLFPYFYLIIFIFFLHLGNKKQILISLCVLFITFKFYLNFIVIPIILLIHVYKNNKANYLKQIFLSLSIFFITLQLLSGFLDNKKNLKLSGKCSVSIHKCIQETFIRPISTRFYSYEISIKKLTDKDDSYEFKDSVTKYKSNNNIKHINFLKTNQGSYSELIYSYNYLGAFVSLLLFMFGIYCLKKYLDPKTPIIVCVSCLYFFVILVLGFPVQWINSKSSVILLLGFLSNKILRKY